MRYRKKIFYLILISTFVRLLIAGTTEFGNDEVYYYTYALHLQWNYFDHPPGVALLIRLSTLNLWLTQEVFIRSGAIICAAIGTWLSYKIGTFINNERTGWFAAILYNTSIYSSIIAGTFILPDSPQVVFWLIALMLLLKMVNQLHENKKITWRLWIEFAITTAVCMLCKIHGVFLWTGLCFYMLFYKRKVLLQPQLYVAAAISIVIFSPVIWWNIDHHFVTWLYHSQRVEVHNSSIDFDSFLQAFLGQVFYNNPLNVIIIITALFSYKKHVFIQQHFFRLILLTGLPIIILVTVISLFDSVLPHWSGPGFLSLQFIAAAFLDKKHKSFSMPVILKAGIRLITIGIAAGIAMIHFYPGTIGSKKINEYGSGDFTLDLYGWKDFDKQYNDWLKSNNQYKDLNIVCNKWFPAAHLQYYVARNVNSNVTGVGYLDDLHQFAWLNHDAHHLQKGENAICIVPGNYSVDVIAAYQNQFTTIQTLHTFAQYRNKKIARYFTVYLLKNYNATDEVHTIQL